jgi:hypothetical protein
MKKLLIIPLVLCALSLNAQIFNTSSTLKRGQFSAGFEPGIYANGSSDFTLFLHGGVGITSGTDLGLKIGLLNGATYVGGDVEFALGKRFSLSFGGHSWGDFALDGTALFTFPIKSGVKLYTGLDTDIIFANETYIPVWLPIGLEIGIKNNMAFLFEAEINLTDVGSHFLGGGLNFYF